MLLEGSFYTQVIIPINVSYDCCLSLSICVKHARLGVGPQINTQSGTSNGNHYLNRLKQLNCRFIYIYIYIYTALKKTMA